uniref:Oleanolic acid 6-beta-oxidase n=1 Tax=Centella asiatica TaxID=48106 RepID=A0A1I9Q5Y6_CENAS|nr:oleanolic acid 6-beta-oxidase [Centella asiatica]
MSLFSDVVLLVIFPIILSLFFYRKLKSSSSKTVNTPPGSSGWPIVGESIKFGSAGPQKFIKERMEKYSPDVFHTSLLGEKLAVFCGAQGNKFVFTNETTVLTSWWPQAMKKALISPELSENEAKEIRKSQKGFLPDILKPEALKQYIPVMDAMARDHVASEWTPRYVVKVSPLAMKYTFGLACRLFMNVVEPDRIDKLTKHFTRVITGFMAVPIDLPGTAYNSAINGGKLVRAELLNIISARREEIRENKETIGRDFLSKMLLVTDEDGEFMTEKEICNNIIGLLVASYETTSTAVTFVLKHLAEYPHIYDKVYEEQMEIKKSKKPGDLLCWEDVQKMKYTWNVACESLRLAPPGQGAFREAATDFTYAGFTIPKGWKVFWTVHTSHRDPKYFPDPDKFDPSRFEGSGPAPYSYVPFGGGPRMCPGKEYARLEILVFIYNVVTNFKLEKLSPNEKVLFRSSLVLTEGLPVRLVPHKN